MKPDTVTIRPTQSNDPGFRALVAELDADLAIRDGEDHAFYDQFNKVDDIKYILVAYANEVPIGCGALKVYDEETMEVKRMFTIPHKRGRGIASQLLNALEQWAVKLGYTRCILETGVQQPEAIALYQKCGYRFMENYGQYRGVMTSKCFEKILDVLD